MTALLELYGATSHSALVQWVVKKYGLGAGAGAMNEAQCRRDEIARRVRRYKDDAAADFEAVIRSIYENQAYQNKLVKLIAVASEQNVTRRIVDEVASLYDKPAVRRLKKRDDEFHVEEKRLKLNELMQQTQRFLWLCNEVLLWAFKGIDGKQKLRVLTPDLFDAIEDPRDRLTMAGVVISMPPITMLDGIAAKRLPCYELWDDTYRYLINASGELVDETGTRVDEPQAHRIGRIPGVLLHRREPDDRLLDERFGRDIGIAHDGVVLLEIMIMRLSKAQGERQPVLKGNLANVAKNQPMNGEDPVVLPPEVEIEMLDSQTDPDHYILAKKDKLTGIGTTYGLSYEDMVRTPATDSSGKALQARRLKLTELRGEQVRRARVNEEEVVTLVGFDPDGMSIDHQEQAIPQDATEELALLDLKMRLGADSVIAYLMRKDPDLDEAAAGELRAKNLKDWATLIMLVRALNIPAGASAANPGNDPQINAVSGKVTDPITTAPLDGGGTTQVQGASARPVNGQHATAA